MRPADGEAFVLMLGSSSEFEVGFDVCEADRFGAFEQMRRDFSPRPVNTMMELELHNVRISVEERVRAGQKIYFVDIQIGALPKPPTITEVFHEAVDAILMSPDKRTNKAVFLDKVKRLW